MNNTQSEHGRYIAKNHSKESYEHKEERSRKSKRHKAVMRGPQSYAKKY